MFFYYSVLQSPPPYVWILQNGIVYIRTYTHWGTAAVSQILMFAFCTDLVHDEWDVQAREAGISSICGLVARSRSNAVSRRTTTSNGRGTSRSSSRRRSGSRGRWLGHGVRCRRCCSSEYLMGNNSYRALLFPMIVVVLPVIIAAAGTTCSTNTAMQPLRCVRVCGQRRDAFGLWSRGGLARSNIYI